jgi:hypothetical protein
LPRNWGEFNGGFGRRFCLRSMLAEFPGLLPAAIEMDICG